MGYEGKKSLKRERCEWRIGVWRERQSTQTLKEAGTLSPVKDQEASCQGFSIHPAHDLQPAVKELLILSEVFIMKLLAGTGPTLAPLPPPPSVAVRPWASLKKCQAALNGLPELAASAPQEMSRARGPDLDV